VAQQTNNKLHSAGVHVRCLDADFGRGNVPFIVVGNADLVGAFPVPHALEIVRQRKSFIA
jgi:hypothetical protein